VRRVRPWLAALLGFAVVTTAPLAAHAGACCLSSSAFGIGRLSLWEEFAVIVGGSYSPVLGRWDENARWHGNPSHSSETEWRPQLSALLALHQRLQVSARVPWVMTQKTSDAQHESGSGIGDSLMAVRFEPIYQGEYSFVPEVAVTAGVVIPTGSSANNTKALLLTDVTGRGAWMLSAAVTVEWAREFWFVQLGGGLTLPLPAQVTPGHNERLGMGAQATLASGAEIHKGMVVSVVGRYASEGTTLFDGKLVPKSQAYEFGLRRLAD